MAMNPNMIGRVADRRLFLWAAILFPVLVVAGYFQTYYFNAFFPDMPRIANMLVHAHGITMSLWVAYFVMQVALIRTKNVKLHMTLGLVGVALAAIVVVVGLVTAYDSNLVRQVAPPGLDPRKFFIIPVGDMALFVLFFAGAVYYRKRPAEHKTLMLMTAINFLPPALGRMPIFPQETLILWLFGLSTAIAVACLIWHSRKHGKINRVFLLAVIIFVVNLPLRLAFAETQVWLGVTDMLAGR